MPSYSEMNVEQLRLCAKEGDVEALYCLGIRLLTVPGAALQGAEALKKAAGLRHLQACERLGSIYHYGEFDLPQDKKQAIVYYEQALALGSLTARGRLIDLYLESEDKSERGLRLLTQVADTGDKAAAAKAARLYLTGEIAGVDFEKAAQYATSSDDSQVMFEAAEKLSLLGVNPALCEELYKKVIAQDREGALLSISDCITLGKMYMQGKGTPKSGASAQRMLRRAIELENRQALVEPKAALVLAELYETGTPDLPADHEQARALYRQMYKKGSEVARLRYIRLCTQDGQFLGAYQAYAETRAYAEAKSYILEQWENIPDKASFVRRAFLFAELTQKENPALRALRDELYRRMRLAGAAADQTLGYALEKRDMQGALTYFESLNPADASVVYGNRELCASLPAFVPGEPEALTALREKLKEVPPEIRRWEEALLSFRGCAGAQEKWAYKQKILPELPEPGAEEPRALTQLRQELAAVSEPPKPAPIPQAPPVSPYLAPLQTFEKLPRTGDTRLNCALDTLPKLPEPQPGEDRALSRLRALMLDVLERAWAGENAVLQRGERTAQSYEKAMEFYNARVPRAEQVYGTHPSKAFAQMCASLEKLLEEGEETGDEEPVHAMRQQFIALDEQPDKQADFVLDTLLSLPQSTAGEAQSLSGFRKELLAFATAFYRAMAETFDPTASFEEKEVRAAAVYRERYLTRELPKEVAALPEYKRALTAVERVTTQGAALKERTQQRPSIAANDAPEAIAWGKQASAYVIQSRDDSHLCLGTQLLAAFPAAAQGNAALEERKNQLLTEQARIIERLQGELNACKTENDRRRVLRAHRESVLFPLPQGYVPTDALLSLRKAYAPAQEKQTDSVWQKRLEQLTVARTEQERMEHLADCARSLPAQKADEEPALAEIRHQCIGLEWKRRLDAFSRLKDENKKREFANGALGQLPPKEKDEDASLSILRSLLTPYQAGNDLKPLLHKETAEETVERLWDDQPPEIPAKPPKKKKKRHIAPLITLVILLVLGGLIGGYIWSGFNPDSQTPQATSAPASSEEPSLSLTALTPTQTPQRYYVDAWDNSAYRGPLTVLDGQETRQCTGIGWFVPSSSLPGKQAGAQGSDQLSYALDKQYKTLTFTLSADQKWNDFGAAGTYQLTVTADGKKVYQSDELSDGDSVQNIRIDLKNKDSLTFELTETRGEKGTLNVVLADLTLE